MTIRERVPKGLRGPIGFGSLGLMIVGVAVGYILTILGFIFTMGLNAPQGVSRGEAFGVFVVGIVALALAWLGWRGFNYFAY